MIENKLGRIAAGAAGLAFAFTVGADLAQRNSVEAQSRVTIDSPSSNVEPTFTKNVACKQNKDVWYPLSTGERVMLNANSAVIPADESTDGVPQYDNDADTATNIGLLSNNGKVKSWTIDVNFPGSLYVLSCDATKTQFYTAVGRESSKLDARLGLNNPTKRVNYNFISK